MTSAHGPDDVRIFHKECVSLAKNGYEVYLVVRGDSCKKKGVHIVGIGQTSGSRFDRITKGTKRVYQKALELDCDVYHLHDPELLPYGLKLKKKGKRVIFDSHERYAVQIANKGYLGVFAPTVAKLYSIYEKSVLKKIDGVVFPCLVAGANIFEGACKNVALIGNQPLLEEVCFEKQRDFSSSPAICYIGGIRYDRGITQAVIACNRANAPLFLAGTVSPETYKKELLSLDEKNLVEFRGHLNRSEVVDLLKESTVGFAASLSIGQNNKVDTLSTKTYEYMGSGIPVIISNSAYAKSVIEKYQFGFCVDPENIDEIANAIRYLLDNPDEAKRMGENGRKAVETEFNWGIEEKKLLQLYQDVLGK